MLDCLSGALGDMVDRDRAFKVKIESATAVAGTNYDELQSEYILPKDSVYGKFLFIFTGKAWEMLQFLSSCAWFLMNISCKIYPIKLWTRIPSMLLVTC
ncbi:MAG: hypothetical protein ACLUDU_01535 [Butyricimonas faecihominis]